MLWDRDSTASRLGESAEREAARLLQQSGIASLPVYSATGNNDKTKAPMLFAREHGPRVAPDILAFILEEGTASAVWIDVKGKTQPGWRRLHPGPRWEHGIDAFNFDQYRNVQQDTGLPVDLLVYETLSPVDLKRESALVPSSVWLAIWLNVALECGRHEPLWPGGMKSPSRRGRMGQGGFLWPRAKMIPWGYAPETTLPAGVVTKSGERLPPAMDERLASWREINRNDGRCERAGE